jgi:hypothetical protein
VVWPQNQSDGFCWFGLKTGGDGFYRFGFKDAVKLVVLNGDDFGYWKNQTRNYLLSQSSAIWEIVQEAYVIPDTLDHVTQDELQRYKNNYNCSR